VSSLKIPYFGKIFFVTFVERLTSTINILLESGLPLVYTLEVSARSLGNTMLENKVLFIAKKVRDGNSLSEQFRNQGIFPSLIAEMVTIGEETGSMPEIFKKVSLHYRKDLTVYIEHFIAAFEPIMIVFMGVMIGGIVIALFLPLFRIATLNQ
jgi:type IV pilus assembly protein PilC